MPLCPIAGEKEIDRQRFQYAG